MGLSSSSLLDESKSNYIKGRTEAELKNFSPHYRRQYSVAYFSQLQEEVEQHRTGHTQLLKQREPPEDGEILYEESVLYFDDSRKWKERFVVVRANYSLECHDSNESFMKGAPPRYKLQPAGGSVLTSEEQYTAMVDKAFPDPNGAKEVPAPPVVASPGQYPVYLRLPYHRDAYFCFHQEDRQSRFVSILTDCIRHQNHDFLKKMTCDVQAFLKAIQSYRQEKGHYESWDMLIGSDVQVLANLVMEELLPSLQTELVPRLKGKKTERKRVWFATVEVAYLLVQDQLAEGLAALREECRDSARQQEALIRSDMDQIVSSRFFLEGKLQATVSEPALRFCCEHVQPYLTSILEELMGPVSAGFQETRIVCEGRMAGLCQDFQESSDRDGLKQALKQLRRASLHDCYRRVNVLREQLHELRNRFKFSNAERLVQSAHNDMQQLMENAAFTFELLLRTTMKDGAARPGSAMEKAKLRVLKQYDYDSSTVRKGIFQEALVDITLPAIKRSLAPSCKLELQKFEQYIFADYTNFIQVENVYEDILLKILTTEVSKVVKEAASLKKHNLFVDSTELHSVSQASLSERATPPRSAPSSPAKAPPPASQQPAPPPVSLLRNGLSESCVPMDTPRGGAVETDVQPTGPHTNPSVRVTAAKENPVESSPPSLGLSDAPEGAGADGNPAVEATSAEQPLTDKAVEMNPSAEVQDSGTVRHHTAAEGKDSGPVHLDSPPEVKGSGPVHLDSPAEVAKSGTVHLDFPAEVKESGTVHLDFPAEVKESGTVHLDSPAEVKESGTVHLDSPPEVKESGTVHLDSPAEVKESGTVHLDSPAEVKESGTVHLDSPPEVKESGPVHLDSPAEVNESSTVHLDSPTEVKECGTACSVADPPAEVIVTSDVSSEDIEESEAISPSITHTVDTESGTLLLKADPKESVTPAITLPGDEVKEPPLSLSDDITANVPQGSVIAQCTEPPAETPEAGVPQSEECTVEAKQEEEQEPALDCVREIRDLVVEIIEVEELVPSRPNSNAP